jgi:peptidoglycan/LPS O-acetylase OafA/YrhL
MQRFGFDKRNQGSYSLLCWLALGTSTLLLLVTLFGSRPDWIISGFLPTAAFGVAAMVSGVSIKLMPRAQHFRSALCGAALLSVSLAYFTAGGQNNLAWIMIAAGVGLIMMPLLLGKQADRQSDEKVINIKLPWR